jgi:hypothetical protein
VRRPGLELGHSAPPGQFATDQKLLRGRKHSDLRRFRYWHGRCVKGSIEGLSSRSNQAALHWSTCDGIGSIDFAC